jgi:hypothetical protein
VPKRASYTYLSCAHCGARFKTVPLWQYHRRGELGARYCLTTRELHRHGLRMNRHKQWFQPTPEWLANERALRKKHYKPRP